ncbi:VOC family protein [Actinomadura sp. NPDC048032]|uniref:VOC family protein n=1 Tax=Actinomadura TaxID=1988 RepID=UPI0031EA9C42
MNPKVGNLVIDCTDLGAMAAFWGGLLGMKTTARSDDWLDLEPLGTGGPVLSFQLVPEGRKVKNRLHLDLDVADIRSAGERAASLGATPAAGPMGNPGRPFQVWRDPEGNEFCFCTAS